MDKIQNKILWQLAIRNFEKQKKVIPLNMKEYTKAWYGSYRNDACPQHIFVCYICDMVIPNNISSSVEDHGNFHLKNYIIFS